MSLIRYSPQKKQIEIYDQGALIHAAFPASLAPDFPYPVWRFNQ